MKMALLRNFCDCSFFWTVAFTCTLLQCATLSFRSVVEKSVIFKVSQGDLEGYGAAVHEYFLGSESYFREYT